MTVSLSKGEVIDRIDTQVENTGVYVHQAAESAKQALKYQGKARKVRA